MNLELAEAWLSVHGRPIDIALVGFEKSGNNRRLVEALADYQNPDGGFGHALEPDIRLEQSSVIATTVALQLLASCRLRSAADLVAAAMKFLAQQYELTARSWANVPTNVDDAPHAPWWEYKPASEQLLNPRAEIVGYMYRWPEHADMALRQRLTDDIAQLVQQAKTLEMHDLLVLERMFHTPQFPLNEYQDEASAFYRLADAAIATDSTQWNEYALTPLTVIKTPTNPLALRFGDAIAENLRYISSKQEADGTWAPTWSWFGHHPNEWPKAELDIRSMTTAQNLIAFMRFSAGEPVESY